MKHKRYVFYDVLVIGLIILFIGGGCKSDSGDNGGGNPTAPPVLEGLPPDPGPGNLAGKVFGTIFGQPLGGVTVAVGSKSTTTAGDGTFRLDGVGDGSLALRLVGDSIYTRTTAVNTSSGRSVAIDAIEVNSSFDLAFYRELARGNSPREGDLFQTHRWINSPPPTFFIDTNGEVTIDGVIDQETINRVRDVLQQIAPVFTGNFYTSINIETRFFPHTFDFDDLPANSFVISFDDTTALLEAYGVTFTEPDFTSPTTSTINKAWIFLVDNQDFYESGGISQEEIIAHESGHGFGFRHTSRDSVMIAVGVFGALYSDLDRLHMAIMYRRPPGNTDIDNDPLPRAKTTVQNLGLQMFIDNRNPFPRLSPEAIEQLEALEGHTMLRPYINK